MNRSIARRVKKDVTCNPEAGTLFGTAGKAKAVGTVASPTSTKRET